MIYRSPIVKSYVGDAPTTRLVREFHDALSGFRVELGSLDDLLADPSGSHEVVCHNDLSIPNTVFRDGEPVAIVDWEFRRTRLQALGPRLRVLWWVPLHRPECARTLGWPIDLDPLRRLRLFCDAYGVSPDDHERLFDVIHDRQIANQRQLRLWVDQGMIPPYDETDESIEVGRTDYIDARRDEFLAALRRLPALIPSRPWIRGPRGQTMLGVPRRGSRRHAELAPCGPVTVVGALPA